MKKNSKNVVKLFYFVILLGFVSINGCGKKNTTTAEPSTVVPIDSLQLPSRGFYMGILPTAAQNQSFESSYSQTAQYSEFVPVWGKPTPFYNLASDLSGSWGETFVTQLIRDNGMFPLINLSFIDNGLTLVTSPNMEGTTLSSPEWRQAYKQAALDVVRAAKPKYLSLGNEVNRWYEKYGESGENGFDNFVSLYEEIYDEVKELSPEIKIFCIFAREIVSENREANLEVLSLFNPDKLDLLIFTSYPYAVQGINRPNDIPNDYYSKAANYMQQKPFGFSEIAWSSLDSFGGEQAQADFIERASTQLTIEEGINLKFFAWSWLHDLDENDTIGLIKFDGTEKKSYELWKNLSEKNKNNPKKSIRFKS